MQCWKQYFARSSWTVGVKFNSQTIDMAGLGGEVKIPQKWKTIAIVHAGVYCTMSTASPHPTSACLALASPIIPLSSSRCFYFQLPITYAYMLLCNYIKYFISSNERKCTISSWDSIICFLLFSVSFICVHYFENNITLFFLMAEKPHCVSIHFLYPFILCYWTSSLVYTS